MSKEDEYWSLLCLAEEQRDKAKKERDIAVDALRKIDEPLKYHHWEDDPYTRAGCFQFVAHEALKQIAAQAAQTQGDE